MVDRPENSPLAELPELLARFRSEWEAGSSPRLTDYLAGFEGESREQLLIALLEVDLEYRCQSGETISASMYDFASPAEKQLVHKLIMQQFGEETATPEAEELETVLPESSSDTSPTYIPSTGSSPKTEVSVTALKQLGDYELLSEIARGGMGVVFKARQKNLNRIVAVKLILSGQFASPEEVQRFYAEAESAARLEHPNIVPIHECGQHDEHHYFSMGFVDGPSLSQTVRDKPYSSRAAAELMLQLAEAAEYAHSKGIVHRDLKPANILLDSEGRPRITDFGLAKSVQRDSGMTATGQVLGTPSYMPPEQALGLIEKIDPTSDVYSLGAVLYEMLVGRPPFRAANIMETLKQVIEHPPASLRQFDPSIDRDLETICLKCLEKDQENRYASAEELATELQRYLNGEPILARPVGPLNKLYRWCRRKPLAVAFVLAVVVLTGVAFFSVKLLEESSRTESITSLDKEIRTQLDQLTLSPAAYQNIDKNIIELANFKPLLAEETRSNLNLRFEELFENELRRPGLTDADLARVQVVLTFFETRDANLANPIRERLDSLRSDWISLKEWSAPEQWDSTLFIPEAAKRTENDFLSTSSILKSVAEQDVAGNTISRAPPLNTEVSAEGDLQFQVEYAENWESAHELSLRLIGADQQEYEFRIYFRQVRSEKIADESVRLITFEQNRIRNREVSLEILRNGSPLTRQELSLDTIPKGPLRIRALREGQSLSLQINSRQPIRFYDPFPLPLHQSYRFGLRLPAGGEITELSLQRKERKSISELDLADEAFSRGDYENALAGYDAQSRIQRESKYQQEALYKKGLSLERLGRGDEAQIIFGTLLNQSGENWPSLAGLQLWLMKVREDKLQEADAVFTLISQRFSFAELAALIPQEVRQELLSAHLNELGNIENLYEYNPQRLSNIERAAEIDRYLSPDGRGTIGVQEKVFRGYLLVGDDSSALQKLRELQKQFDEVRIPQRIARILRSQGQAEEALAVLDEYLAKQRKKGLPDNTELLLSRAQALFALNRDAAATRQLNVVLELSDRTTHRAVSTYVRTNARLLEGFRYHEFGQTDKAKEVWKSGFAETKHFLAEESYLGTIQSGVLMTVALGVLSDEATDQDLNQFYKHLISAQSSSTISAMINNVVGVETVRQTLRGMWLTPYGRKLARSLAYETTDIRERVSQPMIAVGISFFELRGLGRPYVREEEPVIVDLYQKLYAAYFEQNTVKSSQVMQLGLTWKGTTNFLGWDGVEKTLPADIREMLAYVAGHRMLVLKKPAEAEMFFKIAIEQDRDVNLKKLAEQSLAMMQNEQGMLTLHGSSQRPFTVELVSPDKPNAELNWPTQKSLLLTPGKYQIRLKNPDPNLLISTTDFELKAVGRSEIEFFDLLQPTRERCEIPALVSHPASLPGVRDWNLISREPQTSGRVAWSPDGKLIAHGDETGMIRVFEADSGELKQVLIGHTARIRDLVWSHDGSLLASAGDDKQINLWKNGELYFGNNYKSEILSLQFLTGSNFLVATETYQQNNLLINPDKGLIHRFHSNEGFLHCVSATKDGSKIIATTNGKKLIVWETNSQRLLNKIELPHRYANSIDVHPDGTKLLVGGIATEEGCRVSVWDIETWTMLAQTKETIDPRDVQWSPDGKLIALGGQSGHFQILDGKSLKVLAEHKTPYRWEYLSWSPDGTQLVDAALQRLNWDGKKLSMQSFDRIAHRLQQADWNSKTGELILADDHRNFSVVSADGRSKQDFQRDERGTHFNRVMWLPDGESFILLCSNLLELWTRDGDSWKQVRVATDRGAACAAFSPDGKQLATGDYYGSVRIFPAPFTGEPILQEKQQPFITSLCWTADGKHLITASSDFKTVMLRNVEGTILHQIELNGEQIRGVASSDTPNSFWSTTESSRLNRVQIDGTILHSVKIDQGGGFAFEGTPDGSLSAAAFWRGPGIIADSAGSILSQAEDLRAPFREVAVHPAGTKVMFFSESGIATVWNVKQQSAESTFVRLPSGLTHVSNAGEVLIRPDDSTNFVWLVREPSGKNHLLSQEEFDERAKQAAAAIR